MAKADPATSTTRPAPPAPVTAARARVRSQELMRLARRTHLYAGLSMTPWVFLYGITALLFNHPDAFPDVASRRFRAADLAGTPLVRLPRAGVLASRVVDALNGNGEGGYRLVGPDEASFSRELAATARDGGRTSNIRLDLNSGEGSVREAPERPKVEPAPFASRAGLPNLTPPLADLAVTLPKAVPRLGVAGDVSVRTTPELSFLVEKEGRTWRAQYDLTTGALSGKPADAPGDPLSSRRFLTRLHTVHGYPARLGTRWGWAIAVDFMAASMVGWGLTGLLMWWQMKKLRRLGGIVLIVSAVVAATLAVGMHEDLALTNANTRGEPPAAEKSAGRRDASPASPAPEGRPRRTP